MTSIHPYSRPEALANISGRTREGRILRGVRAELTAHVGGNPSATQRALISRAALLTLQVAMLDGKHAKGGMTDHDARQYLAWTNTLTRLMRQLGMASVQQRAPTLAEIRAGQVAA